MVDLSVYDYDRIHALAQGFTQQCSDSIYRRELDVWELCMDVITACAEHEDCKYITIYCPQIYHKEEVIAKIKIVNNDYMEIFDQTDYDKKARFCTEFLIKYDNDPTCGLMNQLKAKYKHCVDALNLCSRMHQCAWVQHIYCPVVDIMIVPQNKVIITQVPLLLKSKQPVDILLLGRENQIRLETIPVVCYVLYEKILNEIENRNIDS